MENRLYIIDSGASYHLVSKNNLSSSEKATIEKCEPLSLQSANGIVTARQTAQIFIKELGIWVRAYILSNTPSLISLGKLCKDHGFKYVWDGVKQPFLQERHTGKRVHLQVTSDVPVVAPAQQASEPCASDDEDAGGEFQAEIEDITSSKRASEPSSQQASEPCATH